jgi:alkanesulfonate monooxygenase SsuD/methylene tetrahydromethanopterin reductase-like flavin-dependent oxidoreductase (luciferase family)
MHIAGDRLRFGVGAGSTEIDFEIFRRDFATRFKEFNTKLEALRALLKSGAHDSIDLTPGPTLQGGTPLLYGTWGKGVRRAAKEFDGWLASATYREPADVIDSLATYRSHGGKQAIVSTIQLGPNGDEASWRATLDEFAGAGFDEAVVYLLPGGPTPKQVRSWVPRTSDT